MAEKFLTITHDAEDEGGIYLDVVLAENAARAEAIIGRLRSSHILNPVLVYSVDQLRNLLEDLETIAEGRVRAELREVAEIRFEGHGGRPSRCVTCRTFHDGVYIDCDSCRETRKATALVAHA